MSSDVQLYNYDYPEFVDNACVQRGSNDRLTLGVMGLCGEAGEVSELVKKYLFHGHDLNEDRMIEEMGDVFWYFTLLCIEMGVSLDDIMRANIAKLRARHGDQHGKVTAESTTFARTGCHEAGDGCHDVD